MKAILTIYLFIITTVAFCQDPMYADLNQQKESVSNTLPQKKDNTIIIQTGLSGEEAFKSWGRHLGLQGYSITESNKDFLTITTGPKDTSKWNYDFIVNSTIDDKGQIFLKIKRRQKSSVVANTRASEFFDWHYQGKNDVFYNDVIKTVNSFGNYPVFYTK